MIPNSDGQRQLLISVMRTVSLGGAGGAGFSAGGLTSAAAGFTAAGFLVSGLAGFLAGVSSVSGFVGFLAGGLSSSDVAGFFASCSSLLLSCSSWRSCHRCGVVAWLGLRDDSNAAQQWEENVGSSCCMDRSRNGHAQQRQHRQ